MKLYLHTCTKEDVKNYIQEQINNCEKDGYNYSRTFYWMEDQYTTNAEMRCGIERYDEENRLFEINTNSGVTEILFHDLEEGDCYISVEKLTNIIYDYLENNYR